MAAVDDPYDLARFVTAQAPVYASVLAELRRGRKESHWIWFIFPQLAALGHSATAKHFGISSLAEARAYLAHPVLGPRLRECATLLLETGARDIEEILSYPDNLKLNSSMTLFAEATADNAVFRDVIKRFFGGKPDAVTLRLLQEGS
jgi:uncharacterized protein (DUF1810 family)